MVAAAFLGGVACSWLAAAGTPTADAQQGAAVVSPAGDMLLATGGCTANTNDIAWVLTKESFEDPKTKKTIERKVLLCYKVAQNGKLTDIVDVRDITWDSKFMQLRIPGHNHELTPERMREEYEKARKKLEEQDR
jgi:hypothetical protein